jgi:CIC family chloride channel protein
VAVTVVAIGAALFAVTFRAAIGFVFERGFGAHDVLAAFERLPWWARLASPAIGGLLAGGASAIAARGVDARGVGDVMEAVVLGGRPMSLRATAWKALGSWSAIVSGGSIGREGPIIQFGGALGSRLAERLGIRESRKRALIAAGSAAGFAAAYNTPLAAVLFVLEVVTGVAALGAVLPAILAAAISTTITRFAIGAGPIYGEHAFAMRSSWELVAHLALGLLAGITAVGFMALLAASERAFARLKLSRPARAALGGAIVGAIACWLPAVTGNGYEAIARILDGRLAIGLVLLLFVAKPLATAASVGSGSPGGAFTPALFLGAALGAALAAAVMRVAPAGAIGPVGGYALVGMAAVVAATTHAPLTAAVLVFEVSGDYAIVLPLLVAVSASTAVARTLRRSSLYMEEVERRGVRWEVTLEGRDVQRLDEPAEASPARATDA